MKVWLANTFVCYGALHEPWLFLQINKLLNGNLVLYKQMCLMGWGFHSWAVAVGVALD